MFQGALRNRCFTGGDDVLRPRSPRMQDKAEVGRPWCGRNLTAAVLLATTTSERSATCTWRRTGWGYLPGGHDVSQGAQPAQVGSSDNIAHAWLTIFQCIRSRGGPPIHDHGRRDGLVHGVLSFSCSLVDSSSSTRAGDPEVYDEVHEAQLEADERKRWRMR